MAHLSLWATTRFFSYKKRANPLSVFAMRARTSAMRVSVAAGDFNLACQPERINRQKLPRRFRNQHRPRGHVQRPECWNNTVDFADDGAQKIYIKKGKKSYFIFTSDTSTVSNGFWNADLWLKNFLPVWQIKNLCPSAWLQPQLLLDSETMSESSSNLFQVLSKDWEKVYMLKPGSESESDVLTGTY